MSDDMDSKWRSFCNGAAEVWMETYQYFMGREEVGLASWFHLGSQVWRAIGESPDLMGRYYQDIYALTQAGDRTVVARAAQFLADNLEVRDHWYVEVLRRTASVWMGRFGPKVTTHAVPTKEPKVSHKANPVEGPTGELDWVQRAIAEAIVKVRNYHTGACGCPEHVNWVSRFDDWASKIGGD